MDEWTDKQTQARRTRLYLLVENWQFTQYRRQEEGTPEVPTSTPHNFFRKRACIEARDHGEPSRAVKSAGAAKRNKWTGPRERSVDGGGGRLCRLRVTLDRPARRGLFPRGERPALGTRRLPRQDRKALRKPGFPIERPGAS
jgi:hypothetical protein